MRIYAPNGETSLLVGWLHLAYKTPPEEKCRIAVTMMKGETFILNGLVVVKDEENGVVAYNPRCPPDLPPFADKNLGILTETEQKWLGCHPHWPNELELDSSPLCGESDD